MVLRSELEISKMQSEWTRHSREEEERRASQEMLVRESRQRRLCRPFRRKMRLTEITMLNVG